MKEFKSAAKREVTEEDRLRFLVDGQEVVSRRPTEGQLVMLMSAEASETRTEASRVAGMIDFALCVFEGDSRRFLGSKLIDPEDNFEFEQLMEIVQWVVEEWSNRPTKPSSDSTSSSENGGTSSTDGASPKELTSFGVPATTPAT